MKAEVYHAGCNQFTEEAFGHVHVANVEVDGCSSITEALEYAYEKTNNLGYPWWNNEGVERVNINQTRSTSVGDIIKIDGVKYRVNIWGWGKIVEEDTKRVIKKITEGYMMQSFDEEGNFLGQEFIASNGEVEYEDDDGCIIEDKDFYAQFNCQENCEYKRELRKKALGLDS